MICIPSSLKAHFCNDTQPLFNRTQVVVLAICAICQRLHICIRKPNARRLWKRALATAGMQDCDGLVLFGGPFFLFYFNFWYFPFVFGLYAKLHYWLGAPVLWRTLRCCLQKASCFRMDRVPTAPCGITTLCSSSVGGLSAW